MKNKIKPVNVIITFRRIVSYSNVFSLNESFRRIINSQEKQKTTKYNMKIFRLF